MPKRTKRSFEVVVRRRSARTRCYAQSNKDFLSKYSIALKQRACPHVASETRYWIELIIENKLAPQAKFKHMLDDLEVIIKILVSITKKLKEK